MRITDVKKLGKGDQVYWNDPDNDECSRMLAIKSIRVDSGGVSIEEPDGSVVECPARELSAGVPPGKLWEDDKIQFARLLCELVAAWDDSSCKRTIKAMAESMDCTVDDINVLFDRAETVWEASKAKHCPPRR